MIKVVGILVDDHAAGVDRTHKLVRQRGFARAARAAYTDKKHRNSLLSQARRYWKATGLSRSGRPLEMHPRIGFGCLDSVHPACYHAYELNILIKSGGGTSPMKPGNRRKLGAKSSGRSAGR